MKTSGTLPAGLTSKVEASTFAIWVSFVIRPRPTRVGMKPMLTPRWSVQTTSSTVIGLPLLKTTPSRIVKR